MNVKESMPAIRMQTAPIQLVPTTANARKDSREMGKSVKVNNM